MELLKRFRQCNTVLILGFSAVDTDVVKILAGIPGVRRIAIVNGTAEEGNATLKRCSSHNDCFSRVVPEDVVYGHFREFVKSGKLTDFLKVT